MLKVLPERPSLDDVVKKFYRELPTQIRHLHWRLRKCLIYLKFLNITKYCTDLMNKILILATVLRIRDVYPGSRIPMLTSTHPESRIQGSKKAPDPGSGSSTLHGNASVAKIKETWPYY
jgi:hypothetical protein